MKVWRNLLLLIAIPIATTGCDKDGIDGFSDEMAIKMSVSVDQTKALITSDNIYNSTIGIYAYKEQMSNAANRYMVFANQELKYSNGWTYSPNRYWDTQAAYRFIAYAPYNENVTADEYSGISIMDVPQWQNANSEDAKDYIVALTDSAALDYISAGGVDLKFHHILANLQISAYYEGDNADFVITSLALGADTCKVPADDAMRLYTQQFGATRADGIFDDVELDAVSVAVLSDDYAVSETQENVADILVAPFDAGANLPLLVNYTENGVEKSAVVNTGISAFESDAVYTINLKFTPAVTDEPSGPSGPGVEVIPGSAYAISDGGRNNLLSINSETGLLEVMKASEVTEYFWQTSKGIDMDGEENRQALYVVYNEINYYLCAGATDGILTELALTTNINEALEFYRGFPDGNPSGYIFTHNADGDMLFLRYDQNSQKFVLENSRNYSSSQTVVYKMLDRIVCNVDEDGYAGPAIYFHIRWNNSNFDFDNKCMDFNVIQRLNFDCLITRGMSFGLGFDGINTRYSYEGNNNVYNAPSQYRCESDFIMQWTVTSADGTDISEYAEMQNNSLVYKQKCQIDTDVIVTLICTLRTDPSIVKMGYYRLTLKGENSVN